MTSPRLIYLIQFLAVCLILLTSLYLQFYKGIQPCPLCTLQRLSFAALGLLFLGGLLLAHERLARYIVNVAALVIAILGGAFAGRQIWLQHFPTASSHECGVSLQYLLNALPLNEVAQKILEGSAECSQNNWSFLFINMAEWALICFVIFFMINLGLIAQDRKRRRQG